MTKVIHHPGNIGQHRSELLVQPCQLIRLLNAINLQVHKRLWADILISHRRLRKHQGVVSRAAGSQHTVAQQVDGQPVLIQLHAQRVNDKRHIPVQDTDDSVCRMPTVLGELRINDLDQRLGRIKLLNKLPE